MNKSNKRQLIVFFSFVILIIGLVVSAKYRIWESKEAKQRREEKIKAEEIQLEEKFKAIMQNTNEMQYREFAVLLSIKYKIDEDKVFDMLVGGMSLGEMSLTDAIVFLEKASGTRIKEKISEYSKKYNISQDVIASIFIDYYSMHDEHE